MGRCDGNELVPYKSFSNEEANKIELETELMR